MHFLNAGIIKLHHVVLELRTSYDTVIHKDDSLISCKLLVRKELHLCNKISHLLILWHETSWPGRSIFKEGPLIRYSFLIGVSDCMTDTGIRNAGSKIRFSVSISSGHSRTASIA